MKKMFVYLCVLLLISYCAVAQNVGIGTINPTAKFHTVGSVKFDTLSGNGIRPVFVDASGNLLGTIPQSTVPLASVTNATSQNIPDNSCTGVNSIIVLSDLPVSVRSATMNVRVNITHTYIADLKIYLMTPSGATLNLWNGDGGSSDNLINTIFTDAGTAISTGTSPYTGNFIPAGNLTAVCSAIPEVTSFGAFGNGAINPNGPWALKIFDQAGSDVGTLNNWTLSIDTNSTGNDGVWGLKGNSGSNNFNFIGTTDNVPLNFRVNNQRAGRIDDQNTSIGYHALILNNSGILNTATGAYTLNKNYNGSINTATGSYSMFKNDDGGNNTATGSYTLYNNIAGSENTVIGISSMYNNLDGNKNTATGAEALYTNSSGNNNTANGFGAMFNNATGNNNTAAGHHALFNNQSGNYNAAIGDSALFFNTSGSNITAVGHSALQTNTANYNTGIGSFALQRNTTGTQNTGVGDYALNLNTTGSGNIAIGSSALTRNLTGGSNVAIGVFTMLQNSAGTGNTTIGGTALLSNTNGNYNTVNGFGAMYNNVSGNFNTAIGSGALYSSVGGNGNTAIGDSALYASGGNNNTTLGYRAGFSSGGNNNIIIGYNAQVPNAAGSNQVRIGDDNVTYAGIKVAWTITSDSRYKSAIQNSSLGLKFINQLRPVSYFRNNDKSEKLEYGFIAQEVEQALQQSGAVNSGIISKDDAGMYSMRYNDLMAPMVKAIQEQQTMIDELKKEIEELRRLLIKK